MKQWQIKEISDLTNVSVRTLHHYDKIGLLKPSARSSNSYRWYSEQDLAVLQQIIALKFFGFSLGQIKTMLQQKPSVHEHLLIQQQMLEKQTEHLRRAQDDLAVVLQRCKAPKSLDGNDLMALIERYHTTKESMSKEIKETWVGKFSEDQQARYLALKQAFPKEWDAWNKLLKSINNNKLGDPEGPDGEKAVKVFLKYTKAQLEWETITKKYSRKVTQKYADELLEIMDKLKTECIPLSPEGTMWFAKAQIAHQLRCWDKLHKDITEHLEADPEGATGQKLAAQWREIITENCMGGSIELFFGMRLLMDAARAKVEMPNQSMLTPEQNQQMMEHIKLLQDPMAISWIEKALKTN